MVEGIECGTVIIENKWYVIIKDKPCKLYRGWRKNKRCLGGKEKVLKLKYTCIVCKKECFGFLVDVRRFCSKSCSAKYNKNNLHSKFIKSYESEETKRKARSFINNAIQAKKIIRPKICSACGCHGKIEAHHPDDIKLNEVVWLCQYCHMKLHYGHDIKGKLVVYDLN